MKQRILLIVAMLLLAMPAFATVNITVTQGTAPDVNKLTVGYNCTAGEAVRAFALNFGFAGSFAFSEVNTVSDFNRGESNKPGGGYGIFPGQFARQIDPANPNWLAQYYTPVAPDNEIDSNGTGFGSKNLIAELGSLYIGPNSPGPSGTLFSIRVDQNGVAASDTLTVSANTIRGGIVLENGNTATATNLPLTQTIAFVVCPIPPASITYPAADGNNGRYQISWPAAANATGYILQRSADGGVTWTTIYTGSATTVCDDVNAGSYTYQVCSTAASCSNSAFTTGSSPCAVVLCFPTSEPNMTTWKNLGKPRCWCYQRQCLGDATGTSEGTSRTGYNRVGTPDLNIFLKSWQVLEPPKGSGIGTCPAGASGSRYTLPTDNKPCN